MNEGEGCEQGGRGKDDFIHWPLLPLSSSHSFKEDKRKPRSAGSWAQGRENLKTLDSNQFYKSIICHRDTGKQVNLFPRDASFYCSLSLHSAAEQIYVQQEENCSTHVLKTEGEGVHEGIVSSLRCKTFRLPLPTSASKDSITQHFIGWNDEWEQRFRANIKPFVLLDITRKYPNSNLWPQQIKTSS